MIQYAKRRHIPIWNVSIQKLMYFAHATFLVRTARPLVLGAFEAWEFGPVCRPIYDALKQHGRSVITDVITRRDPFSGTESVPAISDDIEAEDQVEAVMRSMGHLHPNQLIRLSHVEGGAWSIVWNKSKTGATVANRIDNQLIIETFTKLKISVQGSGNEGEIDEATPFAGD
jgi:uncharacterized phage-associated protein